MMQENTVDSFNKELQSRYGYSQQKAAAVTGALGAGGTWKKITVMDQLI